LVDTREKLYASVAVSGQSQRVQMNHLRFVHVIDKKLYIS